MQESSQFTVKTIMSRKERLRSRNQREAEATKAMGRMATPTSIVTFHRFSDEFSVSQNPQYVNYYYPYVEEVYKKDIALPGGQIVKINASGQQNNVNLTLMNTGSTPIQLAKFSCPNYYVDQPVVLLQPSRPTTYVLQNGYLRQQAGKVKYSFDVEVGEGGDFRNFVTDFAKMQDDENFVDVTLTCDGVDIRAHSAVLAARSKLFNDMLRQKKFVEGQTKMVKIKDVQLATLKEMLKFIYSNKFDADDTDVSALFSAAHLYGVPDLVVQCERVMMTTLTVDNAAGFFFKGFLTELDGLKTASMQFISDNFAAVKLTEGWKALMRDGNSSLALETILGYITAGKK